jgi:hypothetical protein
MVHIKVCGTKGHGLFYGRPIIPGFISRNGMSLLLHIRIDRLRRRIEYFPSQIKAPCVLLYARNWVVTLEITDVPNYNRFGIRTWHGSDISNYQIEEI